MKLRAYNKYTGQHLIIEPQEDSVRLDSSSSHVSSGSIRVDVLIDNAYYQAHPDQYAEDPDLERWSDLTDIEIVNEAKS